MPNWCWTTIKFRGAEEEVKKLYDLIDRSMQDNLPAVTLDNGRVVSESDFGDRWLGNCLYMVGIDVLADEYAGLRCRGEISDYFSPEKVDDEWFIEVFTETAWVPMVQMWKVIIDKMGLKTIKLSFCAEEEGNALYWIYDPDEISNYDDVKIDFCYESESGYTDDLKRLIEYLKPEECYYTYLPRSVFDEAVRDLFPGKTAQEVADKITKENDYDAVITLAEYVKDFD